MKRILFAAAVAMLFAFNAIASDLRDVLLTPKGTLYTAETETAGDAGHHVTLSIQEAGEATQLAVPDSVSQGFRSAPALAYDSESETLFVFFLRMPNIMSSELLLTSYRDGNWTPAISVDNKSFRLRSNLRIALTRRVAQLQTDGSTIDVPAAVIHAVWWEQTGDGEVARYAMIAMDKGSVSNIELYDLSDFVLPATMAPVDPNFNSEILRHPAIVENGTGNSIDALFGEIRTNTFYRPTIRPIFAQGRIHIPIGRAPGAPLRGPRAFSAAWTGKVDAIASSNGKFLLYNVGAGAVSYIMYSNGEWTAVRSVPVGDRLSPDAAVDVLGRMINSTE